MDEGRRDPWRKVGIVVAVVAGVLGLVAIGLVILYVAAMNSYASNK